MSVDLLQEKIRKLRNPAMLELPPLRLPPKWAAEGAKGHGDYCEALLQALKGRIPAVRISFGAFCLLGGDGLTQLQRILHCARELGYYVALEAPELLQPALGELAAERLLGAEAYYPCDGVIISTYLGSDLWKAFLPYLARKKDVFCVLRTGNRSGSELQDRLTGARMLHVAAADYLSPSAEEYVGKFGFSRLGVVTGASSAESLGLLRSKYPKLFQLVDGLDYPNCNAKNCASAFNQFGHGAVVCSGSAITCAWEQEEGDPLELAVKASDRVRRILTGYRAVM